MRYYFLLALFVLILAIPTFAAADSGPVIYGPVYAQVVSVYDGDTVTVNIPEWPAIVGEKIGVRVRGIDTPELRDKRQKVKALALEAKALAVAVCPVGSTTELTNITRGKYFRIVADVWCQSRDLGSALLSIGLAQPYDGETKTPWK